VQGAAGVEPPSLREPSPAVASYEAPEASPSPEMDAASPAVGEEGRSDTVPDVDVAVDAASGHNGTPHNGTAHHLALVAVDTLIPSRHAAPEETASPVDWIGQQTEVPAVVLSESPLTAAADVTLIDEDATPPVEGASRAYAQATIAALDQWLDAIHVARADRRA